MNWFEREDARISLDAVLSVQRVGYTVVVMTFGGPIVLCCQDEGAALGDYYALVEAWKAYVE